MAGNGPQDKAAAQEHYEAEAAKLAAEQAAEAARQQAQQGGEEE